MSQSKKELLGKNEQAVLEGVTVRLMAEEEAQAYDQLLEEQHYLGRCAEVGERLRYVAEYQGQWVGLLSWSSGSYHLEHRDKWIGWSREQRARRLPLVVNNNRFLILEGWHYPNVASRLMKLCVRQLGVDWRERYGHEVLAAESFVDPELFRGTAYKVSGWKLLGESKGYGAVSREYYVKHERPKQLWVRELRRGARRLLCQEELPPGLREAELDVPVRCRVKAKELANVRACFGQIREHRASNWTYALSGLLTLVFCAVLSGKARGQRDLAEYAEDLSQGQLRALGFRRNPKSGRISAPGESTFLRLLNKVKPAQLEQALLDCQDKLLGSDPEQGRLVVFDGKALRSSRGAQLVSAFCAQTGRWLGSELVEDKSNEIPAMRTLLERVRVENTLVLADALHTHHETARKVVQDCGGDYLFTVKGNQKGVWRSLDEMYQSNRESLFFSLRQQPGSASGTQLRTG